LFFGTCDDDSVIDIPGVVATYTAEEYATLKTAEHQARKPFPSWIGDEATMTWQAPVARPNGFCQWDESIMNWKAP